MIDQLGWVTIALAGVGLVLIPATRQHMPPGWYLFLLLSLGAGIGMVVCA